MASRRWQTSITTSSRIWRSRSTARRSFQSAASARASGVPSERSSPSTSSMSASFRSTTPLAPAMHAFSQKAARRTIGQEAAVSGARPQ